MPTLRRAKTPYRSLSGFEDNGGARTCHRGREYGPPSRQLQAPNKGCPLPHLAALAAVSRTTSLAILGNAVHPASTAPVQNLGRMSTCEARWVHTHTGQAQAAMPLPGRGAGDRQDGPGSRASSSGPGVAGVWLLSPPDPPLAAPY